MGMETRGRTLAEDVERRLDDEQEHTAAGREPEHLGHEALVQRTEPLLARHCHQPVESARAVRGRVSERADSGGEDTTNAG